MKHFLIRIADHRLSRHILFWISYVGIFGLIYGKFGNDYAYYFLESAGMLPFVMAATYLTIYVILPFYLRSRHFFPALVYFIGTLLVFCTFQRIFLRYLNGLELDFKQIYDLSFLSLFLETNFMVGIALAIKLIEKWSENQKEKYELERRTLESELNLLKAQIHPHFLFNTMNNLYAMSLSQSVQTSEGIAKVSDLLRSVLYENEARFVSLAKEITFIQTYLDLQRLRYQERLQLTFSVEGDPLHVHVPPMLFITFVENCFKHGCESDPEPCLIAVSFILVGEMLTFRAENSKPRQATPGPKEAGGIGLVNVKKRLELLYPNRYSLNIQDFQDRFVVVLKLQSTTNE